MRLRKKTLYADDFPKQRNLTLFSSIRCVFFALFFNSNFKKLCLKNSFLNLIFHKKFEFEIIFGFFFRSTRFIDCLRDRVYIRHRPRWHIYWRHIYWDRHTRSVPNLSIYRSLEFEFAINLRLSSCVLR